MRDSGYEYSTNNVSLRPYFVLYNRIQYNAYGKDHQEVVFEEADNPTSM